MELVLTDRSKIRRIIRRRRRLGQDHKDEVWNGRYIVMPDPDNVHQRLVGFFATVFQIVIDWGNLGRSFPGTNISNRDVKWTNNYRVPDLAVFLNDNPAEDLNTHWLGGPDLAIEIVSDNDRSRQKLAFYASVGTRELLIVDRDPWQIELFRLRAGELVSVGIATVEDGSLLFVPLQYKLIPGSLRPQVEVAHSDGIQRWTC
jgi:Uma2 family endonuclease